MEKLTVAAHFFEMIASEFVRDEGVNDYMPMAARSVKNIVIYDGAYGIYHVSQPCPLLPWYSSHFLGSHAPLPIVCYTMKRRPFALRCAVVFTPSSPA